MQKTGMKPTLSAEKLCKKGVLIVVIKGRLPHIYNLKPSHGQMLAHLKWTKLWYWIILRDTIEDSINRYIPLSPRHKQGDPPWLTQNL